MPRAQPPCSPRELVFCLPPPSPSPPMIPVRRRCRQRDFLVKQFAVGPPWAWHDWPGPDRSRSFSELVSRKRPLADRVCRPAPRSGNRRQRLFDTGSRRQMALVSGTRRQKCRRDAGRQASRARLVSESAQFVVYAGGAARDAKGSCKGRCRVHV